MFGIGLSEILIILLAIIILIRPEDLPKFVRTVGKLYGKLKHYYNEAVGFKDEVIKEIDRAADWEEKSASEPPPEPVVQQPAAPPSEAAPPAQEDQVSPDTAPPPEA